MSGSKSHNTSIQRLHELTDRHDYMSEFVNDLLSEIQTPENIHLVKSGEYLHMMRNLAFFHENRTHIAKRGYELNNQDDFTPSELEEMHLIRLLDGGIITSIWATIKEFLNETGIDMYIDNSKI